MIMTLLQSERDEARLPRAIGAGFVMMAPECMAEDCAKGASHGMPVCMRCAVRGGPPKQRWLLAHPERFRGGW